MVAFLRRRPLALRATLALLASLFFVASGASDPQPVVLHGLDVLGAPGARVQLVARLRAGQLYGLQRSIVRAPISFYLNDDLLATVETDREGRAVLHRILPKSGQHVIRLFYPGSEDYSSAESYLRLFVCKSRASFVVTDIDFTLARTQSLLALRSGNVHLQAQPRAASVLRRLVSERGTTILYVTAREESLANMTRDWLSDQGFPPGPLFFWDFLRSPLSHADYKKDLLIALKKEWPNLEWGIGDRLEDVRAYQASGLKAIWLPSVPPEEVPEGATVVQSWRDIENLFFPEEAP